MAAYEAALFGKFDVTRDGEPIGGLEARKVRELLGYLLITRHHPQGRETLAELLWADRDPARSRKSLRQTLWKLRSALDHGEAAGGCLVQADPEWIQLDPGSTWRVDVVEFERLYGALQGKRARELSAEDYDLLRRAADLYRGDLLEGWYQDWCVFERERYQGMYLTLLGKLVHYCELHRKYEEGIDYGEQLLQRDRAHERAHRQVMRLHFMTGDRTRALRQYERCAAALREELGIDPSARTLELYEQIRAEDLPRAAALSGAEPGSSEQMLRSTARRLDRVAEVLTHLQAQVQEQIASIENRFQAGR
jgi:DNA-binding SARP family transcriptional activator